MLSRIVILSLLYCFSLNAAHVSLGAKISTLGIGIEAGKKLTPYICLRSALNFFQYKHKFSTSYTFTKKDFAPLDGNKVKISLPTTFKVFSVGIVGDFHPWKNPFALSFGVFYNNNGASVNIITADDPVIINKKPQPRAWFGTIKAKASFNKISPYLGLRYNSGFNDGEGKWAFTADLGCLYQGNLKISKTIPHDKAFAFIPKKEIDKITEKAYKNKFVKWLKFYPVIGFGIHYKFN